MLALVLARLVHEVRSPLQAVFGFGVLLEQRVEVEGARIFGIFPDEPEIDRILGSYSFRFLLQHFGEDFIEEVVFLRIVVEVVRARRHRTADGVGSGPQV